MSRLEFGNLWNATKVEGRLQPEKFSFRVAFTCKVPLAEQTALGLQVGTHVTNTLNQTYLAC